MTAAYHPGRAELTLGTLPRSISGRPICALCQQLNESGRQAVQATAEAKSEERRIAGVLPFSIMSALDGADQRFRTASAFNAVWNLLKVHTRRKFASPSPVNTGADRTISQHIR